MCKKIKILFIKHDAVLEINRIILKLMSKDERFRIYLISPFKWTEKAFKKTYRFQKTQDKIRKIQLRSFFNYHPALYFYFDKLSFYIKKINPDIVFISEETYALSTFQTILKSKKNCNL